MLGPPPPRHRTHLTGTRRNAPVVTGPRRRLLPDGPRQALDAVQGRVPERRGGRVAHRRSGPGRARACSHRRYRPGGLELPVGARRPSCMAGVQSYRPRRPRGARGQRGPWRAARARCPSVPQEAFEARRLAGRRRRLLPLPETGCGPGPPAPPGSPPPRARPRRPRAVVLLRGAAQRSPQATTVTLSAAPSRTRATAAGRRRRREPQRVDDHEDVPAGGAPPRPRSPPLQAAPVPRLREPGLASTALAAPRSSQPGLVQLVASRWRHGHRP